MKPKTRIWQPLCVTVSAMLIAASPALAQPVASVGALFKQGMALLNDRKYAEAADIFEQILKRDPTAGGAEYRLAECHEQTRKLPLAWWHYQKVALLASARGKVPEAELAQQRAKAVRQKIGMLAVRVSPIAMGTPSLTVQLDGWWMNREQWGQPFPMDPGEHIVIASAPGRKRWQGKISVVAGAAPIEMMVPALEHEKAQLSATSSVVSSEAANTHLPQDRSRGGSSKGLDPRLGAVLTGAIGFTGVAVGAAIVVQAKSLSADEFGPNEKTTMGAFSALSFIVGAAGLSAATYFCISALTSPKPTTTARWSIAPYAGRGGAGTVVRYTF